MKTLRKHQVEKSNEGLGIIRKLRTLYLGMEVRTGKTATALDISSKVGKTVLFITKKKAIKGITKDYLDFGFDNLIDLTIINYESVHKIDQSIKFDVLILDEAHGMGAFPKPSSRAKMIRSIVIKNNPYIIMLSGTPTPESYSQLYHQFWACLSGPWQRYTTFYKWANDFVSIRERRIGSHIVRDYSTAKKDIIMSDISPYMVTCTQAYAGFNSKIEEEFKYVKMKSSTYQLCDKVLKDLVVEGKNETILADTPAKLQQKLHQLYSGTIKFESGNRMVLDTSKAELIFREYNSNKLAIFYKFVAEYDCMKSIFGDRLTNDLEEFKSNPSKWYASQIQSGREAINLSEADYLIMYNIDFSATSYWQGRDRLTTKDRERNQVVWIFSEGGIEDRIYKAVSKKKTYTLSIFKQDFGIKRANNNIN